MKRKRLPLIALLLLAVASSGQATPFTETYVFGDSLSDNGNLYLLLTAAGLPNTTPVPVAGDTFIPDAPYVRGGSLLPALSNGPNWAERLTLDLQGRALMPSLGGGTNYAYGGARMAPPAGGSPIPSVREQVDDFLLGQMGQPLDPDALYVVWGGGNDARDAAVDPASATAIIGAYATALGESVGGLVAAGARHLLVPTVTDIGKVPAIQQGLGPAAGAQVSMLSALFVEAGNQVLDGLEQMLDFDLIRFDTYELINRIVASPVSFGLDNVTHACAATTDCIAAPDDHLFWDGIHPTTAGHALLAQAALRAVPEPATLVLLLVGMLGLLKVRQGARTGVTGSSVPSASVGKAGRP